MLTVEDLIAVPAGTRIDDGGDTYHAVDVPGRHFRAVDGSLVDPYELVRIGEGCGHLAVHEPPAGGRFLTVDELRGLYAGAAVTDGEVDWIHGDFEGEYRESETGARRSVADLAFIGVWVEGED